MSTPPDKRADADAAMRHALMQSEDAAFQALPEDARREALARDGYDEGRLDALIAKRLREAGLPSLEEVAEHGVEGAMARRGQARGQDAPVADLGAARARRAARTRWLPLLAAAMAAAVVGAGGVQALTGWRPVPTVSYPTYVPPPSAHAVADAARQRALRLCEAGLYTGCLDGLDEARELDPPGDAEPEVQRAREQILGALNHAPAVREYSKPVGPGEVPLPRAPKGSTP